MKQLDFNSTTDQFIFMGIITGIIEYQIYIFNHPKESSSKVHEERAYISSPNKQLMIYIMKVLNNNRKYKEYTVIRTKDKQYQITVLKNHPCIEFIFEYKELLDVNSWSVPTHLKKVLAKAYKKNPTGFKTYTESLFEQNTVLQDNEYYLTTDSFANRYEETTEGFESFIVFVNNHLNL